MPATERDRRKHLRARLTIWETLLKHTTLWDGSPFVDPNRDAMQLSLPRPTPRRPSNP